MRGFRLLLLFAFLASLMAYPSDSFAAKKKQEKAFPVKVMKASDTKFKHAKIVEKKPAKKKGFLWFKKKDAKVKEAKMARVVAQPLNTDVQQPQVEEAALLPSPELPAKKKAKKASKKVDLPAPTVPELKTASE